MFCQKCNKNNATIKYTKSINGVKTDYNLCQSCFNKINQIDFLDTFFNGFFLNNITENIDEKCNVCGNTYENLKNSGKIGCANCYNVFKPKLDVIFNNMQNGNTHIGKTPTSNIKIKTPTIKEDIILLKQNLKIAIEKEDYEQAIILRDKIKQLERGDF